jgi:hypothetical protein
VSTRFELTDAEERHYPIVKISQYTCGAFAAATEELGVRRSVGRTGVCFDNAKPVNTPAQKLPGRSSSATIPNAST